jgi:cytochrome P450
VQALSYPLPVTVIAEMIGIPAGDREMFKRWSDEAVASLGLVFLGGYDPERAQRQLRLFDSMRAYFIPLADERRRHPREDLLTGLVQAEHEGSKLDFEEMLAMLVLLLVAGNETTTTLIGNAALELLAHPGEQTRLRRDPGLLPSAIEEVLRFASPVQFDPRRAARPVVLHGVEIRENDFVLCWLGSANRDERVFERAESFDVAREKNAHLGFGFGTHYCVGANLARLEARVALGALLSRTKAFERRGDQDLPLHPSPVFRAVTKLPLRLTAA